MFDRSGRWIDSAHGRELDPEEVSRIVTVVREALVADPEDTPAGPGNAAAEPGRAPEGTDHAPVGREDTPEGTDHAPADRDDAPAEPDRAH